MDNDNKDDNPKVVPRLAEVKQFKKKAEEQQPQMTLPDAFRIMAENTEKGMYGTVRQFACVVDSVENGVILIGPTDYARMALLLQVGLQANVEDYMYGDLEEGE